MRMSLLSGLCSAVAIASSLTVMVPATANADNHWVVNSKFTDGATLTGYIDFNVYGYVAGYDLVTSAFGNFAGFEFTPGGANIAPYGGGPGTQSVTLFGPTYNGDQLTLVTSADLTVPSSNNSLTGSTFECQNSYSCPATADVGDVRYLDTSGPVTLGTPEPAAWSLMLVGVGAVGAMVRRGSRPIAA
jgi:hypothetical protein